MTRLLLIRHAEPSEDAHGRCYGTLDVGLSEQGRAQARELAGLLDPVAAVYTSPRIRALETAMLLFPVEPIADERLREIDFGAFEGLTYEEIESTHPELFRRWMETPTLVEFPGGESYRVLQHRVLEAVREILARHPGETVAIVSHGGVARALLADCLAMPDEAIFRLDQPYCSVSVVDWIEGAPLVRSLNASASWTSVRSGA
jgi:broad specificity phosphatase PhoE